MTLTFLSKSAKGKEKGKEKGGGWKIRKRTKHLTPFIQIQKLKDEEKAGKLRK